MSLGLVLLIDKYQFSSVIADGTIGYERLSFTWYDDFVLSQLRNTAQLYPFNISDYEDEGIRNTNSDPYGNPLTCIFAGQLAAIFEPVKDSLFEYHRAVYEFVRALNPSRNIVLYWC